MTKETSATAFLSSRGIAFSLHAYEYAPAGGPIGMQAASALGEAPGCVLKTVMVRIDDEHPACVVVPVDHKINLKKLAALLNGRNARMMKAEDAETLTGFRVGGISPFGQRQRVPTVFTQQAMERDQVYINAGRQGLLAKMSPRDACAALDATVSDISAA